MNNTKSIPPKNLTSLGCRFDFFGSHSTKSRTTTNDAGYLTAIPPEDDRQGQHYWSNPHRYSSIASACISLLSI